MSRDRPAPDDDVRRLLAEVRHVDPVPDDVAARLAGVLDDLAAGAAGAGGASAPGDEGGRAGDGASVVALPSAKRRRRRRVAVLAAAASVVAAVGIAQALRDGVGTDGASSATSAASDTATQDRSGPVDRGAETDSAGTTAQAPGGGTLLRAEPRSAARSRQAPLLLSADPPPVRADRFVRDVRRVRTLTRAAAGRVGDLGALPQPLGGTQPRCRVRPGISGAAGRGVAVEYDGAPAVLLLRPPAGDSQVVDLLQCGTGRVLRSLTLSR